VNVYECIAAVSADLTKEGIGKDRQNKSQGYNFRGIDDCYNALAPLLAKHHLVVLPRVVSVTREERQSSKGGALYFVFVEVEFDFVSAKDGSKATARTVGEAMDSADKASNKAQSAAYKYAAFQVFCIPTEGDNDADASHHEAAPRAKAIAEQHGMTTADQLPANPVATARKSLKDGMTFLKLLGVTKAVIDRIDTEAPGWSAPGDILMLAAMRLVDTAESQRDLDEAGKLLDMRLDTESRLRIAERRLKKAETFAVGAGA
jgi:hypothetical protein